jgi:NADPH-dependent 2,4-dienoyl-CoA reductase/sulfur reductase-like enzyme
VTAASDESAGPQGKDAPVAERASHTIIVGASLAGLRTAEGLRRRGYAGTITLVGDEDRPPYDRPPLSKGLLTGKIDADGTALAVPEDLDAEWRLGTRAIGLDLDRREVTVEDDTGPSTLAFDHLVIATGSQARPWPDPVPVGVHVLRTLDDASAILEALGGGPRVVIVGGGFIGLEVAASCRHHGLDTTVVEPLGEPVMRAVGAGIGHRLAALHRDRGVTVLVGTRVHGFEGDPAVTGVRLAGGRVLPADLVVVGIGAEPSTAWLAGSGIDVDNGVMCDERLRVLADGRVVPGVVAAGDVARWWHEGWQERVRVEHWTNATDQGDAAAGTLVDGDSAPAFTPEPYVWSDQYERKLQVMGRLGPDDDLAVLEEDPDEGRLLVAVGRRGRLVGAVGLGRPAKVMKLGRRIAEGEAFPPEG